MSFSVSSFIFGLLQVLLRHDQDQAGDRRHRVRPNPDGKEVGHECINVLTATTTRYKRLFSALICLYGARSKAELPFLLQTFMPVGRIREKSFWFAQMQPFGSMEPG